MGSNQNDQNQIIYRDDEIEKLLEEIRNNNYVNLEELIEKAALGYAKAKAESDENGILYNETVRTYYFTIFWESFINWLCRCGWHSSTQDKLTYDFFDLMNAINKILESQTELQYVLNEISQEVLELKLAIFQVEDELKTLELVIDSIEKSRVPQIKPEDLKTLDEQLNDHAEQRVQLIQNILDLYGAMDAKITQAIQHSGSPEDWGTSLPDARPIKQREERIQQCIQNCQSIDHPVARKFKEFLVLRTSASLNALNASLKEHPNYLENARLAQDVWDVSDYFPEMVTDINREEQVMALITKKEDDIALLDEQMNYVDEEYHQQSTQRGLMNLDSMMDKKQNLYDSIEKLLLINPPAQDDSPLAEKQEALRESRIQRDAIKKLLPLCDKIDDPIVVSLKHFLIYQTEASRDVLEQYMSNPSETYNPHVDGLLWQVARFFPELPKINNNPVKILRMELAQINSKYNEAVREKESLIAKVKDDYDALMASVDSLPLKKVSDSDQATLSKLFDRVKTYYKNVETGDRLYLEVSSMTKLKNHFPDIYKQLKEYQALYFQSQGRIKSLDNAINPLEQQRNMINNQLVSYDVNSVKEKVLLEKAKSTKSIYQSIFNINATRSNSNQDKKQDKGSSGPTSTPNM